MTRQAVTSTSPSSRRQPRHQQKRGRESCISSTRPINDIAERWIGKFEAPRLAALAEPNAS